MPFLSALAARSSVFALVAVTSVAVPRTAFAYCRSTTCLDGASMCPRDDNGCKTTGKPLYWPSLCVGFSVQKDGTMDLPFSDVQSVIEKSFVTWSDLPCTGGTSSLAFSRLADAACHEPEYAPNGPNANVIMFQDNRWTYRPSTDPTSVDDTLAKTTVSFDMSTGEILDADIEINSAYNAFTIGDTNVDYDLQSVLTHEIGHFIGLDHSLDPDATMNASYAEGDTSLRTLAPDDVAAACAAYAPNRPGVCRTTPKGGLADDCAATASTRTSCAVTPRETSSDLAAAILAALGGVVVLRRRRR